MKVMTEQTPTLEAAKRILLEALGKKVQSINRFTSGYANYVFDVVTDDGLKLVVRLARTDLNHYIEGAVYWYEYLKKTGIPLAKLHYYNTDSVRHGFAVMIMERLEGEDLGLVYKDLSTDQKKSLAKQITDIEQKVASLPQAKGYGYAKSYDDPNLLRTWFEVLEKNLKRSHERIIKAGIFSPESVSRVRDKLLNHAKYFKQIMPVLFLDDATTKNVIVKDGVITGIVDTDVVCFGDSLLTLALTRMSLISRNRDTFYTDFWEDELQINPDQKQAIKLYTLFFCVDFMSEMGHKFNRDVAEVDLKRVERLKELFEKLISEV